MKFYKKKNQQISVKSLNEATFNYVELNEQQMKRVIGGNPVIGSVVITAGSMAYEWLKKKYDEYYSE